MSKAEELAKELLGVIDGPVFHVPHYMARQAAASLQREIELTEKVEKLTRELEEARKDAELLDYIQTNGATVEIIPGAPDFYPVHLRVGDRYRTANENIRDAIRAAIKEQT